MSLSEATGIPQRTLSTWEHDIGQGPRLSDGVKIADACGVGLLWLATGIGAGPQPEEEAAA